MPTNFTGRLVGGIITLLAGAALFAVRRRVAGAAERTHEARFGKQLFDRRYFYWWNTAFSIGLMGFGVVLLGLAFFAESSA